MMAIHPKVAKTVLDDVEPLSVDERKALAEEWKRRRLDDILAYSEFDREFAKDICRRVADKFGSDDTLSALMIKRLNADRKGKSRGPKIKWDRARYYLLLVHYHCLLYDMKRPDVLEELAKRERYTGVNRCKKIETRITEAYKEIRANDLPDGFRNPPPKNNRRE